MLTGQLSPEHAGASLHGKVVVLDDLLHHLDGGEVSENVSKYQHLSTDRKGDVPNGDISLVLLEHLSHLLGLFDTLLSLGSSSNWLLQEDVGIWE